MKRKYKGKYIQRERRIYHGDYLDVNIFPVFNNNFSKKDLEIGLGFDDEHLPETYSDVQRIIRNWGCGHILGLFYADNPRLCLYSTGLI